MKIRKDHQGQLEAILTATQNKQWKAMLGEPFPLRD